MVSELDIRTNDSLVISNTNFDAGAEPETTGNRPNLVVASKVELVRIGADSGSDSRALRPRGDGRQEKQNDDYGSTDDHEGSF